jgi:Family of unknown function (DUF5989)
MENTQNMQEAPDGGFEMYGTKEAGKKEGLQIGARSGIIGEMFVFLWRVRLWWMIPMFVLLLVFFVVFVILPSTPLGPFIYTIR